MLRDEKRPNDGLLITLTLFPVLHAVERYGSPRFDVFTI